MSALAGLNGWTERYDELCSKLDELNANLRDFPRADQQHAKQLREWERYVLTDGGVCTANAVDVGGEGSNLRPAPTGWEAYVTSIAITVSGASNGATAIIYNGNKSDINLVDIASAMFIGSPSRAVAFYDPETFYCEQGDTLTVSIGSAGAATSTVIVRVTGKRRML